MSSSNAQHNQHNMTPRVKVYIDGFNLYFGMRAEHGGKYKWLNVFELGNLLLPAGHQLAGVEYFTSRVRNDPGMVSRQEAYLRAVQTTPAKVTFGNFQSDSVTCRRCGNSWPTHNEKMTDVNIAVMLLEDALADSFDTAILVSGDSDLVPPLRAIKRLLPNKKIIVAFPPQRQSYELRRIADSSFSIGKGKLANAQFPDQVSKGNGHFVQKPSKWV